jgi:hypothetical protein
VPPRQQAGQSLHCNITEAHVCGPGDLVLGLWAVSTQTGRFCCWARCLLVSYPAKAGESMSTSASSYRTIVGRHDEISVYGISPHLLTGRGSRVENRQDTSVDTGGKPSMAPRGPPGLIGGLRRADLGLAWMRKLAPLPPTASRPGRNHRKQHVGPPQVELWLTGLGNGSPAGGGRTARTSVAGPLPDPAAPGSNTPSRCTGGKWLVLGSP